MAGLEHQSWVPGVPTSSTFVYPALPKAVLVTPWSHPLWPLEPAILKSPCGKPWSLTLFFPPPTPISWNRLNHHFLLPRCHLDLPLPFQCFLTSAKRNVGLITSPSDHCGNNNGLFPSSVPKLTSNPFCRPLPNSSSQSSPVLCPAQSKHEPKIAFSVPC